MARRKDLLFGDCPKLFKESSKSCLLFRHPFLAASERFLNSADTLRDTLFEFFLRDCDLLLLLLLPLEFRLLLAALLTFPVKLQVRGEKIGRKKEQTWHYFCSFNFTLNFGRHIFKSQSFKIAKCLWKFFHYFKAAQKGILKNGLGIN